MSGAFDFVGSENGNTRYYTEKSIETFFSNMDDQIMAKLYSKNPTIVYLPEFGRIRLNRPPGSAPKKIMISGVFVYPSSIPEYNESVDNYPMTNAIFSLAKEVIVKESFSQIMSTPPNNVSNSADDASVSKNSK